MKTFFKKFKASAALDRDGQSINQIPSAATQFSQKPFRALNDRLRESRCRHDVPPDLHQGVMRAVRTLSDENAAVLPVSWWPRVAAGALVLAVGVGVFWSVNRPPVKIAGSPTEPPPSLAAAMEQGRVLTQAAPATMLEPLAGELELLDGDLQNAVNFLVASVP